MLPRRDLVQDLGGKESPPKPGRIQSQTPGVPEGRMEQSDTHMLDDSVDESTEPLCEEVETGDADPMQGETRGAACKREPGQLTLAVELC